MAVADLIGFAELHRYSLEEYHRLIEAGAFDEDERVELLDGLLVKMTAKTPQHELAIQWFTSRYLRALSVDRYVVAVGSPLTIVRSEPEPDISVVERGTPTPYHPGTAALVIEVSVSSLARDLGVKPALYAAAGIPDYWVLDVRGRRIVVHRQPTPDGYAERVVIGPGESIAPIALELRPLELDAVLAAAGD